jgi:hypothetical protein
VQKGHCAGSPSPPSRFFIMSSSSASRLALAFSGSREKYLSRSCKKWNQTMTKTSADPLEAGYQTAQRRGHHGRTLSRSSVVTGFFFLSEMKKLIGTKISNKYFAEDNSIGAVNGVNSRQQKTNHFLCRHAASHHHDHAVFCRFHGHGHDRRGRVLARGHENLRDRLGADAGLAACSRLDLTICHDHYGHWRVEYGSQHFGELEKGQQTFRSRKGRLHCFLKLPHGATL